MWQQLHCKPDLAPWLAKISMFAVHCEAWCDAARLAAECVKSKLGTAPLSQGIGLDIQLHSTFLSKWKVAVCTTSHGTAEESKDSANNGLKSLDCYPDEEAVLVRLFLSPSNQSPLHPVCATSLKPRRSSSQCMRDGATEGHTFAKEICCCLGISQSMRTYKEL